MKQAILILAFLVIFIALPILAVAAETVFESKSYLHGEAGLTEPWEKEVLESTNLSGAIPDFERDYMVGEGGLVNPIEGPMEK